MLINDIPDTLPAVRADRDKISRVLMNLVDNALKFSSLGGQVLIQAEFKADDQTVMCTVLDTGPGIPADAQAKLKDIAAKLGDGSLDPCTKFEGSNPNTFCVPVKK